MSFFKKIGQDVMGSLGGAIGNTLKKVGEATDNRFLGEVGDGVHQSMQYTGGLVGGLTDSAVSIGAGIIDKDNVKIQQGWTIASDNATDFCQRVSQSVGVAFEQSKNAVNALTEGDIERAKTSGLTLTKMVAVSVVSIGVIDGLDGIGSNPEVSSTTDLPKDTSANYIEIENYNTHEVSPHFRELPSGEVIWVDGDGDTSVDRQTGWEQTNPNYRIKV